jgi:glycosyltransferase involved in cell wall biosynthesis
MPSTVLDLEASALPASIAIPEGHQGALALIRWHGHPVAKGWLTTPPGGMLRIEALSHAVEEFAGDAIAARRLHEFLGWDDATPEAGLVPTRVTIAICARDRLDDLGRCLRSMDGLPGVDHEVLVIDNASQDGNAVRNLVASHPRARYVLEPRVGLDVARNRALREARGDVVAFCDDDAIVDPGWLRALSRHFADPRTLCVTGLTMPAELESEAQEWFERTNSFTRGFSLRVFDGAADDAFFASRVGAGVNMSVRRSVLDLVGPFDEALDAGTPTKSGGDHDMFTRILLAGYRIVYDPAALSWHRHRREWPELRDAVRGYGTGVWAYLTAQVMRGELRALVVALRWLMWQLIDLARAVLLRSPKRVDLSIAELRGCFAGPGAYFASRRALARARAASLQAPAPEADA